MTSGAPLCKASCAYRMGHSTMGPPRCHCTCACACISDAKNPRKTYLSRCLQQQERSERHPAHMHELTHISVYLFIFYKTKPLFACIQVQEEQSEGQCLKAFIAAESQFALLVRRAETDAVLVSAGVHWQPFSDLALAELPQVATAQDWSLPEHEVTNRRDLRGSEYFTCSIDPPGQYTGLKS